MKQPPIGWMQMHVGDLSILSQAYRELHAAMDRGDRSISPAALQRFRQIITDLEDLSDSAARPLPVSDVWGVAL